MILVDSSIWIDHLRRPLPALLEQIEEQSVLCHALILGEVAMGSLKDRDLVLTQLRKLERSAVAKDSEVLAFITEKKLYGKGIGYIDAHLLVSTMLTPDTKLWSRDKRLLAAAVDVNLAHSES